MKVSFVPLQDFNDGQFSLSVSFIRIQDFNDVCCIQLSDFGDNQFCSVTRSQLRSVFSASRICSVMKFQRRSVLFLCSFTRFQRQSVLIRYEISMVVGFLWLQDLNDGWVFNVNQFCFVIRFQGRLVSFLCSSTSFQRQSVLFLYEISVKWFC